MKNLKTFNVFAKQHYPKQGTDDWFTEKFSTPLPYSAAKRVAGFLPTLTKRILL